MKVRCINNRIDDQLAAQMGMVVPQPNYLDSLTIGRSYTVLGMFFDPNLTEYYGGKPAVEIKDDVGNLSSLPIFMFEVIEHTPSKYWQVRCDENGNLTMYPESFYREYYHEDLSDGDPEIEEDFARVFELLEAEAVQFT